MSRPNPFIRPRVQQLEADNHALRFQLRESQNLSIRLTKMLDAAERSVTILEGRNANLAEEIREGHEAIDRLEKMYTHSIDLLHKRQQILEAELKVHELKNAIDVPTDLI